MKKAAILSITAFYLLLTTGMFVCVMNCTAEKLFKKPEMAMGKSMAGSSKHHAHSDDCDCCKKHGDYIIKENLKPGFGLSFTQAAIAIHPVEIPDFLLNIPAHVSSYVWADINAPPGKSGKDLSIQIRSLLI